MMEMSEYFTLITGIFVVLLLVGAWAWIVAFFKKGPKALLGYDKVIVNAFENAVTYRGGKFDGLLQAGVHWIRPPHARVVMVDIRPEVFQIAQGSISADRLSIILRCVARVQIADPRAAVENAQDYRQEVFANFQSAIKEVGANWTLVNLHEHQSEFAAKVQELVAPLIKRIGVECLSFELLQVESSHDLPKPDKRDVGFRAH